MANHCRGVARGLLVASPLLLCVVYGAVIAYGHLNGYEHLGSSKWVGAAAIWALPIGTIAGVLALAGWERIPFTGKLLIMLCYAPFFLLFLLLTGN